MISKVRQTPSVHPDQLESWQVYNNAHKEMMRAFFPETEKDQYCIKCLDLIPPCDRHHSGLCVGCWLLDHPIN